MSNILNFSTGNSQITDEIINVANSNPVNLAYKLFYNKTGKKVVISTASGGGGTVLTETTDWTSGDAFPDANLPSTISPDVAYTSISIVNATYHSTNLYVSYYPIGSEIDAALWNNSLIWESAGDFDISSSNQTLDLTTINSYPDGYKFRVSWYDGDGSNTFSFTNNSETIDGIAITNYTGDGTGHLDLIKIGTKAYETRNSGEIWDSDCGNFNSGDSRFDKYLTGKMLQYGDFSTNDNITNTAVGFYRNDPFQAVAYALSFTTAERPIVMSTQANAPGILISGTNPPSTTGFSASHYRGTSSATNYDLDGVYIVEGRWTTAYLRKS